MPPPHRLLPSVQNRMPSPPPRLRSRIPVSPPPSCPLSGGRIRIRKGSHICEQMTMKVSDTWLRHLKVRRRTTPSHNGPRHRSLGLQWTAERPRNSHSRDRVSRRYKATTRSCLRITPPPPTATVPPTRPLPRNSCHWPGHSLDRPLLSPRAMMRVRLRGRRVRIRRLHSSRPWVKLRLRHSNLRSAVRLGLRGPRFHRKHQTLKPRVSERPIPTSGPTASPIRGPVGPHRWSRRLRAHRLGVFPLRNRRPWTSHSPAAGAPVEPAGTTIPVDSPRSSPRTVQGNTPEVHHRPRRTHHMGVARIPAAMNVVCHRNNRPALIIRYHLHRKPGRITRRRSMTCLSLIGVVSAPLGQRPPHLPQSNHSARHIRTRDMRSIPPGAMVVRK